MDFEEVLDPVPRALSPRSEGERKKLLNQPPHSQFTTISPSKSTSRPERGGGPERGKSALPPPRFAAQIDPSKVWHSVDDPLQWSGPIASGSFNATLKLGSIPVISTGSDARKPSALLHSPSNGGEGQKWKKKEKGKAKEVVDLTISDGEEVDDDIIIESDRPICIGQLTSLALVVHPTAELVISQEVQAKLLNRSINLPIHVYRAPRQGGNETLRLMTPGAKAVFGVMEHKVANVLGPLLGEGYSGTGVTNNISGKVWCSAAVVRTTEPKALMLPLNLLLFTLEHNVQLVSNTLHGSNLFLDHPASYDPDKHSGYLYRNPHNPAPGVSGRASERKRTQMTNGLQGIGIGYSGDRVMKTVEVQREQVKNVFDNLKSGMDLEELEPHPMITTKLYPHQKQALSFLLDRETVHEVENVPHMNEQPIVSLWQRRVNIYDKVMGWTNVVTDLEITGAAPPPQARGAILADDMGCGKTVVVIALVAATLEEAKIWATSSPTKDFVDPRCEEIVLAKKKLPTPSSQSQSNSSTYGVGPSSMLSKFQSSDFAPNPPPKVLGKGASKKAAVKAKREKARGDANVARFARLVVRSRATLIICPLSTVQNWESQIDEHVVSADGGKVFEIPADGVQGEGEGEVKKGLSVYVYHGIARTTDAHELAKYDVVITTFSTLGTEFSKQSRAEEEREEAADAAAEEADALQMYDADGQLIKTLRQIAAEEEAALEASGGKLKRKRKKVEGTGASPLQEVQWFRVVLDEAHIIKEHTTIQARAACDLSASRRTALSGTPLQNSLNDLFSLVRFLRLEPFTDRVIWTTHIGALAKNNDPLGVSRLQLIMRHIALRRTKQSKDKNGQPILDLPPNNLQLVSLTLGESEHAFYSSHHQRYKHDFKKAIENDSVLKNYCSILQELLRLRQICVHMALVRDAEDLSVGEEGDVIKNIAAHGISKSRGIQLLGLMRDAGGAFCSECGTEMILGDGVNLEENDVEEKKPTKRSKKSVKSTTVSINNSEDDASLPSTEFVITRCQHLFCQACFKSKICVGWPTHVKATDRVDCSICRIVMTPSIDAVPISSFEVERALAGAVEGETVKKGKKAPRVFEHSTKTLALIRDLLPFSHANPASVNFFGEADVKEEEKTSATGGTIGFQPVKGQVVKSVVFSQWTKLLDRVGDALDDVKIKYGRLDGSMNRDARTKAMDDFRRDPSCEILVVSLRAGGVGLNLTAARRVYMMEPFWNPAVENQAIDRIHRLGQTMPVQTIRFVIAKSIEEKMLKIQERKTDLANMSLGQTLTKAEVAKRRLEDLKELLA